MQALAKIEAAKDRFVSIYQAVHKVDDQQAKQFYEVEAFNFKRQVSENKYLAQCSELSVAGVFLEVISNGLSFDSSSKHVYLIPRGGKLTYSYASDGLIYLCTAAGSIKSCTVPVLVYEGDKIEVGTKNGQTYVNHSKAIPNKSTKILGGFCYIHQHKAPSVAFWMGVEEIERLKRYSAKANGKRGANDLYSSGEDGQIDEGFFRTKITKAALKNFRKKKTLVDNHFDDDLMTDEAPDFLEIGDSNSPYPNDSSNTLHKETGEIIDAEPVSENGATPENDSDNSETKEPMVF